MKENRPDVYEYFGTYPNDDARRLLDAFVGSEIDFTLNGDEMGIQNMSAIQAASGGTCGRGAGIAISVHVDDLERSMAIRQRVLKILP